MLDDPHSERIRAVIGPDWQPLTVEAIEPRIGPGWYSIIDRLVADLLELGWDGRVLQVKEKFGGLRFYIEQTTEVLHNRIDKAKDEAYRTCEVCGKPGFLRNNGWIETRCDEHASGPINTPQRVAIDGAD
jgi:hypothetical protein